METGSLTLSLLLEGRGSNGLYYRQPACIRVDFRQEKLMGIYGIIFAFLVAATVFLVVSIFFGVERRPKVGKCSPTTIGTIPIV